jgi:hypothetical protein
VNLRGPAIAIRREFVNCRIFLFSGQAVTADLLDDAWSRGYNSPCLEGEC